MQENTTWDDVLNEHWRQFKLACESMNRNDMMPELNWREYVLYDLCQRHNQEIGKEYFKFDDRRIEKWTQDYIDNLYDKCKAHWDKSEIDIKFEFNKDNELMQEKIKYPLIEYRDKDGNEIDFLKWKELFDDFSYRLIRKEYVWVYFVSTVWLGIEHRGGHFFETIVFKDGEEIDMRRYETLGEALVGHEEFVQAVKDGKITEVI